MYAEASTRATNSVNQDALNAIQEVQKRAGYQDRQIELTTTTEPTAFLAAVSNERGWEFFAEMKRWFELVRLEKVKRYVLKNGMLPLSTQITITISRYLINR